MFDTFQLLDLSVPLSHQPVHEPISPSVKYVDHQEEAAMMKALLGVSSEDLVYSGGQGWAVEEITAITHTGTHVDAPYHYHPTSEGRPSSRAGPTN